MRSLFGAFDFFFSFPFSGNSAKSSYTTDLWLYAGSTQPWTIVYSFLALCWKCSVAPFTFSGIPSVPASISWSWARLRFLAATVYIMLWLPVTRLSVIWHQGEPSKLHDSMSCILLITWEPVPHFWCCCSARIGVNAAFFLRAGVPVLICCYSAQRKLAWDLWLHIFRVFALDQSRLLLSTGRSYISGVVNIRLWRRFNTEA